MSAHSQTIRRLRQASGVACVVALIGAASWWFRIGIGPSFDLLSVFTSPTSATNAIILSMDELSYEALKQTYGSNWNRSIHADLLRYLKKDGSGPVIFDTFLPDASTPTEDADLASAIKEHGQVILAAALSKIAGPGLAGTAPRRPFSNFVDVALGWGVSDATLDFDGAVRRHALDDDLYKSLASAAFTVLRPDEPAQSATTDRWLRYYSGIQKLSYYLATNQAPGFFKDKIVVIGGTPRTKFQAEEVDEFRIPYTLLNGELVSGADIHTTMLLNLLNRDWLTRLPPWAEFIGVTVLSLMIGFGLRLLKPVSGALAGIGCALLLGAAGVLGVAQFDAWFPWVTLAGVVVPGAWIASLAVYKGELRASRSEYSDPPAPLPAGTESAPHIPGYALLRCIGRGAYGEVWIARNHIGTYNAVKVVFRNRLPEARAYEREFRGIRRYTPVSLQHPGLVKILHVGRDDNAQYFHYVMELGDDEVAGQKIDPETYQPRNFAKDLAQKGRLPVTKCVAMGIALCEPLEFLHARKLMHRDIKPANIIFFDGIPKLADVGLVTEYTRNPDDMSYMGTEGYMAESPTKPSSDIYSFGKVLYEALTGLDRRQFPALPDWIESSNDVAGFMALNSIILRCCDRNAGKRYQHAGELHETLLELERRLAKGDA